MVHTLLATMLLAPFLHRRAGPAPTCVAEASSLTPAGWSAPPAAAVRPATGLRLMKEVPLPGPPNRFDYQSVDSASGRIYMNHMNAGRTVVFDAIADSVVGEVTGVPRATGVLAVPSHHQVYVSVGGRRHVAIIDDRTLRVVARAGDIAFPDGIAYAPEADKVFVSDEAGGFDVVIDPNTLKARSSINLGGEAGNTHYDPVSRCIVVAVQTRNQLVAIDPATERVVRRYALPGSDHPHGFAIAEAERLAFVTSEESALLQVVDLRTMRVTATYPVGEGPDVVAWDASWRRLYVASEGGVLSAFALDGATLRPAGEIRAPHAHTVSVDPRTHRVYVPLENVGGRPVLRIYEPGS